MVGCIARYLSSGAYVLVGEQGERPQTSKKAKTKTILDIDDCIEGGKNHDMLAADLGRETLDRTVREVLSDGVHLR